MNHSSSVREDLRSFLTASLIAVLVFVVYSNSFDCSWQLDDITNICKNRYLHVEDLTVANLKKTLVADPGRPGNLYRPVACLTFGLNHYLGGLQVFGYHLVNVVVHMMSSILLFLFLRHTLNSFSFAHRYASRSYLIALTAALMWALHPVQVQSVTYIVQRMNSLAGFFYILSMYLYAKGRTTPSNRAKGILFGLCAVSFFLALGAKENAILLPVSVVLYEILVIQEGELTSARNRLWLILGVFVALLVLSLLYIHFWKEGVYSVLEGYAGRPFSLSERVLTEPRILLFYVSLLIYPVPQRFSVAHSFELSRSLIDPPTTLIAILVITGSVVFLILKAKKNPLISFSFLFFLLNHLVESSIMPLELAFEHRNYVPSMLFFIPFSLWLNSLLKFRIRKCAIKPIISGLMLFMIIFLGYSTYLRNLVWKSPGTLWSDALEKAPDQLRVHHSLGLYYQEQGLKREALVHYLEALRSPVIQRKDEPVGTYYQLGKLYGEMGEYEKSKSAYKQAISMKPDLAWAYVDLAAVYDREGDRTTANEYLAKAIKVGPTDPSVNLNVGVYYLRELNPEAAIHHLEIAAKDKERESKSRTYLGIAFKQREEYEMAEHQFKRVLALSPKNITPQLHLAEIYFRTGKAEEAEAQGKRITELLMEDRELFSQVIALIVKQGNRGDVCLSRELLLPLFSRSLKYGSNNEMRAEMKKMIDNLINIR